MNVIIIAARGGAAAKTRLSPHLDAAARAALTDAMLDAMLTALRGRRVVVVSPTLSLLARARARGAIAVAQTDGDLNAAFAIGCVAARRDASAFAWLPGDLPLVNPAEVDAAFVAAHRHGAVVARSQTDGGTGAVVMRAGVGIAPTFGPDSFARHMKALPGAVEMTAPSLAADIDTIDHFTALTRRLASSPASPRLLARFTEIYARRRAEAA